VHVLFLSPSSSLSRPPALPLCLSPPPSSLPAYSFSFSASMYTYVYICIFVYVYVHTHIHTHTHRHIHNIHAHTHTHKHVLSFSHTRTLTHKHKHAQTQAHTNTRTHLFLPTRMILFGYYDTRKLAAASGEIIAKSMRTSSLSLPSSLSTYSLSSHTHDSRRVLRHSKSWQQRQWRSSQKLCAPPCPTAFNASHPMLPTWYCSHCNSHVMTHLATHTATHTIHTL